MSRAQEIEDLLVEASLLSLKELMKRVKDGTASHQELSVIRQWAKDNDVTINTMQKDNPFAVLMEEEPSREPTIDDIVYN